ncbi:CocE/NonD family hydrolase [Streptomyces sp. NPDC059176]|uniref:CocE/NonD family hydrolase n=1 Tax=Streptomyces sp. NPDC059176 TaxID=3346758 RepID=UPI00369E4626
MRIRTAYPYEIRHEDLRIPLADGTRLHARLWRPITDAPVPALLEYLPHRLTDGTAARDRQRHPWYAGHGYASVRVDARGHGNSEGLPGDPFADSGTTGTVGISEITDGSEVVAWLAAQPWCSGSVGMFGIGWGGCNALRVAARAPEPLKAVVAVCADEGTRGNAFPSGPAHSLAAALLARTAQPPDPRFAGSDWRAMWLERLEALRPLQHARLGHPTGTGGGRGGPPEEGYGAIRAAVLAVGGWHDPYRDTVLRLVEHLDPARVRGIIGPWSHQYPDSGLPPGPAIGFLQETLRWWDHWLKEDDPSPDGARGTTPGRGGTGVPAEPLLRSWISESHPPATSYDTLPGRWVADDSWPSSHVTPVVYALQGTPLVVASPAHTGLDAGRFVPRGEDGDLPPDQRDEDAGSASFDFVLTQRLEILGRPRVRLRVRRDTAGGQAFARLCDVAPDGSSTLVTRGALHLGTGRENGRTDERPRGAFQDVAFDMSAIGHAFPPGHRVRLAVSSAYWPWTWPDATPADFTLDPEGSSLELPARAPTTDAVAFEEAEHAEPLDVVTPVPLDPPSPGRLVVRDVAKGERRLETGHREGTVHVHPDGLEVTEAALETYTIRDGHPLSACARSDRSIRLHRPEVAWDVTIDARSDVTCDAGHFLTSDELVCRDGAEVVFHRTWEQRIERPEG